MYRDSLLATAGLRSFLLGPLRLFSLAITASLLSATGAWAQADYPSRPIRVIVPLPAGSSPDVIARLWGDRLAKRLGQPVVIENRAGAATIVGAQAAVTAPADGYTLFYTVGSTTSLNPYIYPKERLPYKTEDFEGVVRTVSVPYVLVVSANSATKSVADLLDAAKKTDGRMNFASYGMGQTTHVLMARFLNATGTRMTHVPYKDGGITDLISGIVDASFEPSTTAIPHIAGGKLRGLAVTSAKRLSSLPDVPALSETMPGFASDSWQGVLVRKGTPAVIVQKIAAASQKILVSEEFRARARELGLMPVYETPAEFQKFIAEDARTWSKVVKNNNIRAE
jgi:tripartite-type tricarboxylate transporter receptor subunit TctC